MTTGAAEPVHAPATATKRNVSPLTWAALGVSTLAALSVWLLFVANVEPFSALPEWTRDGTVAVYLIYVLPVDLILITWAGSRGRKNHRLSVLALGMFSPLLYFVGGLIIFAIFPH